MEVLTAMDLEESDMDIQQSPRDYQELVQFQLESKIVELKQCLNERVITVDNLEDELESMSSTVREFMAKKNENENESDDILQEKYENNKDSLVFHGIEKDAMEKSTEGNIEVEKNFLEHNIRKLLNKEWGIDFRAPFRHFSRYKEGPKLNGLEPILVIFEHQKQKENIWAKIRENTKKSQIVVTQFDSKKKVISKEKIAKNGLEDKSSQGEQTKRKQIVIKAMRGRSPVKQNLKKVNQGHPQKSKSVSPVKLNKRNSTLSTFPEKVEMPQKGPNPNQKPDTRQTLTESSNCEEIQKKGRKQPVEVKKRKPSRAASLSKDTKSDKTDNSKDSDAEIYGTLDASRTLLLHGLESDFIEEQMADDEDFRKEVLEQKVNVVLNSLGFTRPIRYKFLYRWDAGPPLNDVLPVLIEFVDKKDKVDVYSLCKTGLEKTEMVVTEDARSRLAGEEPKDVSNKLNFSSFIEHYKSYAVSQALYNKMVKLL